MSICIPMFSNLLYDYLLILSNRINHQCSYELNLKEKVLKQKFESDIINLIKCLDFRTL